MESGWNQPGRYCEIVQIGAVELVVDDGFRELRSFQVLVQPQINSALSEYFIDLTGITQTMVDAEGVSFSEALTTFMDFARPKPIQFASFDGDEKILEMNCGFSGLPMPAGFANCVDIRRELLDRGIIEEDWISSDLPHRLGLPSVGRKHDALADSRAIAATLRHVGVRLD